MCNKVGMQLASVHSDTEMTLLMSLVSQAKVTDQTFTPKGFETEVLDEGLYHP